MLYFQRGANIYRLARVEFTYTIPYIRKLRFSKDTYMGERKRAKSMGQLCLQILRKLFLVNFRGRKSTHVQYVHIYTYIRIAVWREKERADADMYSEYRMPSELSLSSAMLQAMHDSDTRRTLYL